MWKFQEDMCHSWFDLHKWTNLRVDILCFFQSIVKSTFKTAKVAALAHRQPPADTNWDRKFDAAWMPCFWYAWCFETDTQTECCSAFLVILLIEGRSEPRRIAGLLHKVFANTGTRPREKPQSLLCQRSRFATCWRLQSTQPVGQTSGCKDIVKTAWSWQMSRLNLSLLSVGVFGSGALCTQSFHTDIDACWYGSWRAAQRCVLCTSGVPVHGWHAPLIKKNARNWTSKADWTAENCIDNKRQRVSTTYNRRLLLERPPNS